MAAGQYIPRLPCVGELSAVTIFEKAKTHPSSHPLQKYRQPISPTYAGPRYFVPLGPPPSLNSQTASKCIRSCATRCAHCTRTQRQCNPILEGKLTALAVHTQSSFVVMAIHLSPQSKRYITYGSYHLRKIFRCCKTERQKMDVKIIGAG